MPSGVFFCTALTDPIAKPDTGSHMTDIVYPSLSEDAWVTGGAKQGDYLFSNFMIVDKSQTYLYDGLISSFPWIVANNKGDIPGTLSAVRTTLSTYFGRYFHDVVVDVSDSTAKETPSTVQLSIYISYMDKNNKQYVLGKMIQMQDTIVKKIININNG